RSARSVRGVLQKCGRAPATPCPPAQRVRGAATPRSGDRATTWARLPAMRAVVGFVRAQIAEIERDDPLRWYGAAMAFLHVVTYLYWVDQRIAAFVHAQAEPICWPLVP